MQNYERATGHQVIVWIGETTGDVPLETYTGETAHTWHVGRRGHDDGAVLFLFMADHKVRIEVGYGLESALTDADSFRIIQDQIVPRMRRGDTEGAVRSGVAAMLTTITPSYAGMTPPPAETAATADPVMAIVVFVLILLFFAGFAAVVAIAMLSGRRRGAFATSLGSSSGSWFSSSSESSSGSSGSDDDFSSGGGDFGGGGASGSW